MAVQDPRWLQAGDSGEDVRAFQHAANVWILYQATIGVNACNGMTRPAPLAEDGLYGPLTTAAAVWLQCRMGIRQDGLVGPETLGALARHLAAQELGHLSYGGQRGVLPVRYTPSDQANALRVRFGLPALGSDIEPFPGPRPEGPPGRLPGWLVAVAGALGLLLVPQWLRRR